MTHHMAPGYILTQKTKTPERGFAIAGTFTGHERFRQVLAVGPTLLTDFNAAIIPPCKEGDIILVSGNYETEVHYDGAEYFVVKFQEVLSTVEGYDH